MRRHLPTRFLALFVTLATGLSLPAPAHALRMTAIEEQKGEGAGLEELTNRLLLEGQTAEMDLDTAIGLLRKIAERQPAPQRNSRWRGGPNVVSQAIDFGIRALQGRKDGTNLEATFAENSLPWWMRMQPLVERRELFEAADRLERMWKRDINRNPRVAAAFRLASWALTREGMGTREYVDPPVVAPPVAEPPLLRRAGPAGESASGSVPVDLASDTVAGSRAESETPLGEADRRSDAPPIAVREALRAAGLEESWQGAIDDLKNLQRVLEEAANAYRYGPATRGSIFLDKNVAEVVRLLESGDKGESYALMKTLSEGFSELEPSDEAIEQLSRNGFGLVVEGEEDIPREEIADPASLREYFNWTKPLRAQLRPLSFRIAGLPDYSAADLVRGLSPAGADELRRMVGRLKETNGYGESISAADVFSGAVQSAKTREELTVAQAAGIARLLYGEISSEIAGFPGITEGMSLEQMASWLGANRDIVREARLEAKLGAFIGKVEEALRPVAAMTPEKFFNIPSETQDLGLEAGEVEVMTFAQALDTYQDWLSVDQMGEITAWVNGRGERVSVTAVKGEMDFFLYADRKLAEVAGPMAASPNQQLEGVTFHVSGDLRDLHPERFQTPGLALAESLEPFDFFRISNRLRGEKVSSEQMRGLRPVAWVALSYNPQLKIEHVLNQGVLALTIRDDQGTVTLIFA